MIEQLLTLGSVLDVGAKAGSIYSTISSIAGWDSGSRILRELQKTNQEVKRLADGVTCH